MPSSSKPAGIVASTLVVIAAICGDAPAARGCPFCSAVSLTFAQEIAQSQAAVLARLVEPPTSGSLSPRAEGPLPKGKFAVVEVLKGSDLVQEAGFLGGDAKPIETILLEEKPIGTLFLLMGIEPPNLIWSSPIPISQQAVPYLKKLADLPEKGADRLAFFQQYLESPDETLARDAYDEFAVAPYADVRNLESRMDPTQLLEWIENPKIQSSRRRLYATMLGVCGTKADAARIEKILIGGETPKTPSASGADSDDDSAAIRDQAELRSGLDALIACSVTLRGADGLDLIDRLFLDRQGRDVPFTETYAAVMALRFLGEELDSVPRARVLQSLRLLLKEPKLADLVIADLARWGDWSVIDTLSDLFVKADADNIFVREPVVNYLKACPLPEAAVALEKLEKIDPEAVRRAATLAGFAGAPSPKQPSGDAEDESDAQPSPATLRHSSGATVSNEAAPEDTALAARISPVLADEEATDDRDGVDPSQVPVADGKTDSKSWVIFWKWGVWGAVVLLVGFFSRSAFRSGAAEK